MVLPSFPFTFTSTGGLQHRGPIRHGYVLKVAYVFAGIQINGNQRVRVEVCRRGDRAVESAMDCQRQNRFGSSLNRCRIFATHRRPASGRVAGFGELILFSLDMRCMSRRASFVAQTPTEFSGMYRSPKQLARSWHRRLSQSLGCHNSPPFVPIRTLSLITVGAIVSLYPSSGSAMSLCQATSPVFAFSATSLNQAWRGRRVAENLDTAIIGTTAIVRHRTHLVLVVPNFCAGLSVDA